MNRHFLVQNVSDIRIHPLDLPMALLIVKRLVLFKSCYQLNSCSEPQSVYVATESTEINRIRAHTHNDKKKQIKKFNTIFRITQFFND